jgi:hypothetical protein
VRDRIGPERGPRDRVIVQVHGRIGPERDPIDREIVRRPGLIVRRDVRNNRGRTGLSSHGLSSHDLSNRARTVRNKAAPSNRGRTVRSKAVRSNRDPTGRKPETRIAAERGSSNDRTAAGVEEETATATGDDVIRSRL